MKKSVVILDGYYMERISKAGRDDYLKIDFSKLKDVICDGEICVKIFYYHCAPYIGETKEEQKKYIDKMKFFKALQMIRNCEIRIGDIQRVIKGDTVQYFRKQVEIFMTMDMMHIALLRKIDGEEIDCVYFVCNNANMMPVIKNVVSNGIEVKHVSCEQLDVSENFVKEFSGSVVMKSEQLEKICL